MPRFKMAEQLPFVVKVCGVTNEEDLAVAVEAGANAIGFNFYAKSPRYLDAERARRLTVAVSGNYIRVGVFVNPAEDELIETASTVQLDVLQLHGVAPNPGLSSLFRIWIGAQAGISREGLDQNVEAWLLDTPTPLHGGSGKTFDWSLAAGFPRRAIVAGGLDGSNVADAIAAARPWGVDACSKLESEPGRKDPERVRAFVDSALAAFRSYQEIHT